MRNGEPLLGNGFGRISMEAHDVQRPHAPRRIIRSFRGQDDPGDELFKKSSGFVARRRWVLLASHCCLGGSPRSLSELNSVGRDR